MRTLKLFLILGVVLCVAVLIGGVYFFLIRPATLPAYQFNQQPSNQKDDFMATTLTLGDRVYVSDATEFPLEVTSKISGKWGMIGMTPDGMEIYPIPQQDEEDYFVLVGDMFPGMIFRSADLPPIHLNDTQFDTLELRSGSGRVSEVSDTAIINEVVQRLIMRDDAALGTGASPAASLHLFSCDYPGLSYLVYTGTDSSGQVFLAEKQFPEEWVPAGPKFTEWFRREVNR